MAPYIGWYDDSDDRIVDPAGSGPGSFPSFSGITPGTPTAGETVRLYNDKDGTVGADPIRRGVLLANAKLSAASQYLAEGLPVLDQRMVQVKVVSGLGGLEVVATGWVNIGTDAFFLGLPQEIASTEGVELQVRISVPASDTQVADTDVALRLNDDRALALATGFQQIGAAGILSGIGDDTRAAFFFEDVAIVAQGTPDDTVDVAAVRHCHAGIPYAQPAYTTAAITKADKDAVDITGTEGYWYTLSAGGAAGLTWTKGALADPVASADKEAAPAGEKLWGWIAVTLTGGNVEIETADITRAPTGYPETAAIITTAGLDRTYSGYRILGNGRLLRESTSQTISHADGTTEYVWAVPSTGTLQAAATAPEVGAVKLWEVTTLSGAIASEWNRRLYLSGREHIVNATAHSVAATGKIWTEVNPYSQSLWLAPDAIRFVLHVSAASDDPSSLNYSGGAWSIGIKTGPPGALVTLFTTGPETGAPSIDYDATNHLDRAALAELLEWKAGEALEISIAGLPTGPGDHAAGLTLSAVWRM